MGLTCLVRWKNASGVRDSAYIDEKVKKSLHGKFIGGWEVEIKVYRDASQVSRQQALMDGSQQRQEESRLLYQVSHQTLTQPPQPSPCYCMVDGGVIVEADENMDLVLARLKNLWQQRQKVKIKGISYEIGDFTLRTANILIPSYKGLLLEIEYRPYSTPNKASELINEFVTSILPSNAQLSCEYDYNYEKVGLSNHEFTKAHTGYQYMMLFRNDKLL